MTARPQDVALLPLPKRFSFMEWDTQMRDYARANVTAALASAQAREEELRAEVEFHKLDAGALRVQMDVLREGLDVQRRNAQTALTWFEDERGRAERLEEALRAARQKVYMGELPHGWTIDRIDAALTPNAAQPGETT